MEKTVISKEDPKGLEIKRILGTFTAEQYKLIRAKFATDDAVSCAENQGRARTTVLFEKGHLRISPLDVYAHRGSKVLCLDDYPVGDKAMCFVDIAKRLQNRDKHYLPKEGEMVELINEPVILVGIPENKKPFQNLWRVSKYIPSNDRELRPQIFIKSVVTNDEISVSGWLGLPTIDVIIDYYKSLSINNLLRNSIDSSGISFDKALKRLTTWDVADFLKSPAWLSPFLRRQLFDTDFVFADERSSFKNRAGLNAGFSYVKGKNLKDIWYESEEIMNRTYAGIKPEQSLQFKLGPIEITKQEPQEDGTVKITFGADVYFEERKTGMGQEDVKEATDALKDILAKGKTLDELLTKKEIADNRNIYSASPEPFTVSELGSLSSAIALMGYNLANGISGTPELKARSAEALKLIHSKLIEKPKTNFSKGGMVAGADKSENGSFSRISKPEITVSGNDLKVKFARKDITQDKISVKSEKQHDKDRAFYLTDKIKICLGTDIKVRNAWIDELREILDKFSEEYYSYDERNS